MRISGGKARGIPLATPRGDATRPATDGMRQAVFSSLGARLPGAHFLDLFAGSGAYGLEALSRGAAAGVWVERQAKAVTCIRTNIAAVQKSLGQRFAAIRIVKGDATLVPWPLEGAPDIVFIDPPYEIIPQVAPVLMERLAGLATPVPDPLVVFEMPGGLELETPGWICRNRLGKGGHGPGVRIFQRDNTTEL